MTAYAPKNKLGRLTSFLRHSRRTLFLIIVVASITTIINTLVAVWLSHSGILTIPGIGTIRVTGMEAYGGDLNSTGETISLDWGMFHLPDSKNASFYLRSISNIPLKLAFNVTNWSPEGLSLYMTLSWNYTGAQIAPNEEIQVTFNLSLSSSIDLINYLIANNVTSFNFDIYIYALS
jgi:hypothetical protein